MDRQNMFELMIVVFPNFVSVHISSTERVRALQPIGIRNGDFLVFATAQASI